MYSEGVTKPPTTLLAQRLQDRVAALGISYAELARRTGQAPGNISRWMTGRVTPTLASLQDLASALETTTEAFVKAELSPERAAAWEAKGKPCPATAV